ncbi:MAG: hypothetical protein HN417_06885, partial [Desulfobacula sp.]|nr:hypothetical protein [Desulfobacula sp.]
MSENSWRNFQTGYILGEKKKSFFSKSKKFIFGMMSLLVLIAGIYFLKYTSPEKKEEKKQVQLSKNQLTQI